MGFTDDVDREMARRDESRPPIEDPDHQPRLAELEPGRLAVLHEFGIWTLMLLREPWNYAAQRDRLRQAVIKIGEALRGDEYWVVTDGVVRPTLFGRDDFTKVYGRDDREGYELEEDFEKSALRCCSDDELAALLYEQARRPWPVSEQADVPDDLEPIFERGDYRDDVMVWLYRGHAVLTTAATWGVGELLGAGELLERRAMVVEHFGDRKLPDEARALLHELPDVSQLEPEERAALAGTGAGDDWTFALAHDALPPPAPPEVLRRRDSIPAAIRREVWRRDQGRCVLCGSQERIELDHIIPVSLGGSSTARNLQILCQTCNRKKGARI